MKKILSFLLVIAIVIGFGVISVSAKATVMNAKVDDTLRDYLAGKSDDEKVTVSVILDNSMSDEEISIYQKKSISIKKEYSYTVSVRYVITRKSQTKEIVLL